MPRPNVLLYSCALSQLSATILMNVQISVMQWTCSQLTYPSWRRKWMAHLEEEQPHSLATAIKHCHKHTYPNLHILMKVACSFGVTSCECERSFSTLRHLNTYLHKTMKTEHLSALALMNILYGFSINYGLAATKFLQLHPRKIQAPNLLFENKCMIL